MRMNKLAHHGLAALGAASMLGAVAVAAAPAANAATTDTSTVVAWDWKIAPGTGTGTGTDGVTPYDGNILTSTFGKPSLSPNTYNCADGTQAKLTYFAVPDTNPNAKFNVLIGKTWHINQTPDQTAKLIGVSNDGQGWNKALSSRVVYYGEALDLDGDGAPDLKADGSPVKTSMERAPEIVIDPADADKYKFTEMDYSCGGRLGDGTITDDNGTPVTPGTEYVGNGDSGVVNKYESLAKTITDQAAQRKLAKVFTDFAGSESLVKTTTTPGTPGKAAVTKTTDPTMTYQWDSTKITSAKVGATLFKIDNDGKWDHREDVVMKNGKVVSAPLWPVTKSGFINLKRSQIDAAKGDVYAAASKVTGLKFTASTTGTPKVGTTVNQLWAVDTAHGAVAKPAAKGGAPWGPKFNLAQVIAHKALPAPRVTTVVTKAVPAVPAKTTTDTKVNIVPGSAAEKALLAQGYKVVASTVKPAVTRTDTQTVAIGSQAEKDLLAKGYTEVAGSQTPAVTHVDTKDNVVIGSDEEKALLADGYTITGQYAVAKP